jgi:uncharacterized membrane protein
VIQQKQPIGGNEMAEDKVTFLVIKYPHPDTAMQALAALKQLSKEKVVKLKDAVAITKTDLGKIKLHQTKDDSTGKGFLKGGLIGVLLATLFGPAAWIAVGAVGGTVLAIKDRGIKNKLLKELGEKMHLSESAVAILVEQADWQKAVERMKAHNFHGEVVVADIAEEDLAEVEKLLNNKKAVAAVPEVMEVPAPVEEAVVETSAAAVAEEEAPAEVQRKKKLAYIEGVGEAYSQKLVGAGITTVEGLLEKGATPQGRNEIVKTTGISDKLILRWVNMADLYRIKGIGQEYAELLEAAGVDTVPELAQRVPANLLEKMTAANEQKKLVRRLPVLSQVESWVAQAKVLPRLVTY